MKQFPPIAALASSPGASAVAVLRISGCGCHELLAPLLGLDPEEVKTWPERVMKLAHVQDPASGEVVDDALVVLFRGPRSFTGEDSAEIQAHGGPFIVQRLLEVLYRSGFRAADPGEFTKRAFLHGKLDLTAAEGIKELVEAQSHQQWSAARQLATGRLKSMIEGIRTQLIETLAYLEAQIDFPDEGDTAHLTLSHVTRRSERVEQDLEHLLGTYHSGRVASQGLVVTLFGCPNAGKSTLLNTLLGKERAIVTPIPGTTRDYLEESCLVQGRLLRLIDVAGMRESPDPVEAIGVESAKRLAADADLVLFLLPADGPAESVDQLDQWLKTLHPKDHLVVVTKGDLGLPPWAQTYPVLSCKTGAGLDGLRAALSAKVDQSLGATRTEPAFITSARHARSLQDALDALARFHHEAAQGAYVECLAFELGEAVKALESIVGRVETDDILDQIFSQFCLGK